MVTKRKRDYPEPRMVDKYWKDTRGTLISQFEMVKRTASCGNRVATEWQTP